MRNKSNSHPQTLWDLQDLLCFLPKYGSCVFVLKISISFDTEGRTMQDLPRVAQVIGQRSHGELIATKRRMFIIFLPYIGQAKQSTKYTKNPHTHTHRTIQHATRPSKQFNKASRPCTTLTTLSSSKTLVYTHI